MFGKSFGQRHGSAEPPIEMRFVDLFMIIVTALMFMIVMLSIVSAFVGGSNALAEVSPRIISVELPAGLANRPYSVTLAGIGGSTPYTWKIISGALPGGLGLDEENGIISGTPEKIQQTQFIISLNDNDKRSSQKEYFLEILQVGSQEVDIQRNLYVIGDAVYAPDGQINSPYSFQLSAFGGVPPYSWVLIKGNLPSGIDLTEDGQITGNPTTISDGDFEVEVKDSQGESLNQKIHLVVNSGPDSWWKKMFVYLEIVLRVIAYILLVIILYVTLFVDREEGIIRQEAYESPWTRFRKRFRR
ncbi:MAG: putative Ig domain-containing protein [Anaerolineae bacterium]|nr:putative Ig domain-containing protein [Anaerolineae bacterium]MBL8105061.1 putative Ig domain-containing protein [Anaerolineales bacterium]